jgi:hypothetical protein
VRPQVGNGQRGNTREGSPTYKGFQRAEKLRDALEATVAGSEQFFISQARADGEVFQSQEVDIWMVGVVAL